MTGAYKLLVGACGVAPALTVSRDRSSFCSFDPAHLYLFLRCFAVIALSSFNKLTRVIHHVLHNNTESDSNFKVFVLVFKQFCHSCPI